jgi:2-methylaconitate cis-trans-isomerase PrpF
MDVAVRAAFWRGGTSRAALFRAEDLAAFAPAQRDAVILAALGSPDPYGREIDGLGAGISSLSKAAIIDRAPAGSGADVTFRFAQVDVESPRVEFAGTCGNMSAAVGPFALDTGLLAVPRAARAAHVTVLSTNTGQRYVAHFAVRDGRYEPEGDFAIDGVPGTASRIGLEYLEPGGSLGRGLLPTGHARECVRLEDGRELEVSIVDAANPVVFVRAADVGADATELPAAIDADLGLVRALQALRAEAAVRLGLAATRAAAEPHTKAIPKVAFVAPPRDYAASDGKTVGAESVDVVVRMLSMGKAHRTLAMTTALCTTVAAAVEGTVVAEVARPSANGSAGPRVVRLGHAAGVLPMGADVRRQPGGGFRAVSATTYRTARKIMDGCVYVPASYLEGRAWFQH